VYWRALPEMLAEKLLARRLSARSRRKFLRDVIKGQRMLYMALRIHDDIFDRHVANPSLIFASDLFLIEAELLFSKHLPKNSKFWEVYRKSLRTTIHSIVEADKEQNSFQGDPERLLDRYAHICAIFKVGSAAVCGMSGQWNQFATAASFCDEMAKAGQIVDDFVDLQEDIGRNRYNYVAKRIFRLAKGDWVRQIFQDVYFHTEKARRRAMSLRLEPAVRYVSDYERLIQQIQVRIRKSRVDALFRPLINLGSIRDSRKQARSK